MKTVHLYTAPDHFRALSAKALLEEHNILCLMPNENLSYVKPYLNLATGGFSLFVGEALYDEARSLLVAYSYMEERNDNREIEDQGRTSLPCPHCGSLLTKSHIKYRLFWIVLSFLLFFVPLEIKRNEMFCGDCGYKGKDGEKQKNSKKTRTKLRKKRVILPVILILLCLSPFFVNLLIVGSTKNQIHSSMENLNHAQAALLLGAGTYSNQRVSQIVYDRIVKSVELYKAGKVDKILISGDHGSLNYDEVNTIKTWLLKYSVAEEDIFMDHAGFSTYESVYRAKEIFDVDSMVVVTQEFHLPRAIFIANRFQINSQGFIADRVVYGSRRANEKREFLARNKDFLYSVFLRPEPTYLGEMIPITGDGRVTQD